jgi:hypothetical protein
MILKSTVTALHLEAKAANSLVQVISPTPCMAS